MNGRSLLSPISIRLSCDVATVECETCRGTVAVATEDRDLLVARVRAFLQKHGCCQELSPG